MRTSPLGPSVELPMGPQNAVLGGADACERCHWGLRYSSLLGHGLGGADACKRRHCGLRWSAL
eukprot:8488426-Pyramimonas_sp.AAC.1